MSNEQAWPNTAVILCSCPLQRRIASEITDFLYNHSGSIIDYDQYVDLDLETPRFFARVEWDLDSFELKDEEIRTAFESEIASRFDMQWELHLQRKPVRLAVMVTKETAGLYQIMMNCTSNHWNAKVPIILSNRTDLEGIVGQFGVDFKHLPITKETKEEQEQAMLALYRANEIDLVILARYMQIVTSTLIDPFRYRMINIHHSMLPAFAGARPYHQARKRGVKFIGATGHYVTEELDAGPIIEQETVRISHKNTVAELVNEGRNLETVVLCKAIELHVQRRIIVHGGRTVIFR
jgi:formyltetrahydrofolate deformylase